MKILRWPFTLTSMASTHKIGLVRRWECECAIADKKFILIDFQCNSTINILLFCYIFSFSIPELKVLTNRWICFWYALCNINVKVLALCTATKFFIALAIIISDHFFMSCREFRQYRYHNEWGYQTPNVYFRSFHFWTIHSILKKAWFRNHKFTSSYSTKHCTSSYVFIHQAPNALQMLLA